MMKEKIEIIIKFGVPIIVLLIFVFAMFFASNSGGAFGLGGLNVKLILSLALFIALYIIAGIIVWAVSKNNFMLISAILSLTVIFIFYMIFAVTEQFRIEKAEQKKQEEYKQQVELNKIKLKQNQQKYDSLTNIIENSENNYKEIEKRALLFFDKIYEFSSSKDKEEKRKKHIEELEFEIRNNPQKINIYYILNKHYSKNTDKIAILEKALEINNLSEEDRKYFEQTLGSVRFSRKDEISRIKANNGWYEEKIEDAKLLIKSINNKFKNEDYNDIDLVKRGIAYCELNKDKKALADYNKALELNPNNTIAIIQKARVLSYLEQYSEAIALFEKCKEKYPHNHLFFVVCIDEIKEKQKEKKE